MEETNSKSGWTEAEKLGLLFQALSRMGKIPWPEMELPPGRTLKACQVMVDREKTRIKKANQAGMGDADKPDDHDNESDTDKTPSKKRKKSIHTPKKRVAAKNIKAETRDRRDGE